ncbi:serine/threonine-protein kinase [Amycolatopsis sp. 195334CR]|uniref:serine/threonine-protein kinase n=1 Tax=Amycolatopsis sp. 195334CR TaxID=2814588 RepID=UPI001A8ECE27|nr:serine/threonine-protein kinase [Amycolatopsis sp. 195334CR]MBN6040096.1 serine/threonine protein kinase [Amycolatopsis sp. 195334CR]
MEPLDPREPRQLGPYRIIAALGEGGMGRVVLGLAPDGRLVAVKQLHPHFVHDTGFRERFRREVTASRLVSGAYTAAVMDADPEAETPWLASVFVTGPSLREAVDALGPLPVGAVRRLAAGLAAALTEIHRAALVHRDLKPSNILLTADGPRVIDFGIARAIEDGHELTGTGSIIGSPAFMSPEQAGGGQVTAASDMFSLGAVLVMAATGQGPFTGTAAAQTLYNVVHTEPDLTTVPAEIRVLAEPCLAKDPALRPTPEQVLDFLGRAPASAAPWPPAVHARIQQQDAEVRAALSLPLPAWRPPPRPPRIWLRWAVAGVVVALVAALTTAIIATRGPDDPGVTALPMTEALTLDRLRRVDPCQVLDGDFTADLGTLEPESNPIQPNRCYYSRGDGGDGIDFELQLGDPVPNGDVGQANRSAEGMALQRMTFSGGCDSLVLLPTQPQLHVMIYNATKAGDPCAIADSALSAALTRLRTAEVDRPADPASVLPLDPCALPDAAVAEGALNGGKPRVKSLRTCEWVNGSNTLTVEVKRSLYVATGETIDLGGGLTGEKSETGPSSCRVTWQHRLLPDGDAEYLSVGGNGLDGGNPCEQVRTVVGSILPKLPKPQ